MDTSGDLLNNVRNSLMMAASASAYLYYQNCTVQTTTYFAESPKFQGALTGFTIAQLSDLHFPNRLIKLNKLIKKTAAIKPNIIVLSGDLIAGDLWIEDNKLFEFGQHLVDIAPTFAVFGNRELNSPVTRKMEAVLTQAGVQFLHDEAVTYSYHGEPITIMGLLEKRSRNALLGDALRYITLTPEQIKQPKILIAHHPEAFIRYHEDITKSPDLVLTGHAHGGQIRVPGIGGLFAPDQGVLPKYTEGVFFIPGNPTKLMIVSRGIGPTSFPLRINNRPEIVAIQLTDSISRTSAGNEHAVNYRAEVDAFSIDK